MNALCNLAAIAIVFPALIFAVILAIKPKTLAGVVSLFLLWLFGLIEAIYLIAHAYSGKGFTAENLFHLRLADYRDGWIYHSGKISLALTGLLVLSLLVLFLPRWIRRERFSRRWRIAAPIATPLMMMLLFLLATPLQEAAITVRNLCLRRNMAENFPPEVYTGLGISFSPVSREAIKAKPGRNLLWIFLESTERTYLDEKNFPGLLPNLQYWCAQGADFTATAMSPGALSTFGALYAVMLGSVMTSVQLNFNPWSDNTMLDTDIGNKLGSVSWILHRAGYKQVFMMGATANFTGTDIFLYREGFDRMWSSTTDRRVDNPTASIGCYDRDLFPMALEEYKKLSASGEPFNLCIRTLDGHPGNGFFPPDGVPYLGLNRRYNMLDALHNSDIALGKFLSAVRELPGYENLCVILTTDHLLPNGEVVDLLTPHHRSLVFAAPNSPRELGGNLPGSTVDIGATVLDLMGVEHNYVFPLGCSMRRDNRHPVAWDATNFRRVLGNFMLLHSDLHITNLTESRLTFQEKPFPAVRLGESTYPLYVNSWSTDLPRSGEAFVIRIDGSTLEPPLFFHDSRLIPRFRDNHSPHDRYIIFGRGPLPPECGLDTPHRLSNIGTKYFLLLTGDNRRNDWQLADRPENLKLEGNSLK